MSYLGGIATLRSYSIRRRLMGWKMLPLIAVSLLPSLVAFIYAQTIELNTASNAPTPYRLYGEFLAPMCLYFVAPFVAMLTMLPVLGDLYDKGAIGYLLTRPVPRWVHVVGLYQGGLLAMLPLMILAALLPALLLMPVARGIEFEFWLRRVGSLAGLLWISTAIYGALCMFLGVWSRKAILWALGLLFGWGSFAGSLPGDLRATSPQRYLFTLMREWLDVGNAWSGFFVPDPEPPTVLMSALVLAGFAVAFFMMAVYVINRRDIL